MSKKMGLRKLNRINEPNNQIADLAFSYKPRVGGGKSFYPLIIYEELKSIGKKEDNSQKEDV